MAHGKGKEQSGKFIKCHCRFIKTRQKRRTRDAWIICVLYMCACVCVIKGMRLNDGAGRREFVLLGRQLRCLLSPSTAVGVIYKSFLAVLWDFATVSFSFWSETHSAQWLVYLISLFLHFQFVLLHYKYFNKLFSKMLISIILQVHFS